VTSDRRAIRFFRVESTEHEKTTTPTITATTTNPDRARPSAEQCNHGHDGAWSSSGGSGRFVRWRNALRRVHAIDTNRGLTLISHQFLLRQLIWFYPAKRTRSKSGLTSITHHFTDNLTQTLINTNIHHETVTY